VAAGPPGGGAGGGVCCGDGTSPYFRDCTFVSNSAYHGGGIRCSISSSATCVGCVFLENQAIIGAGVMSSVSHLTLERCTFSGNFSAWHGAAVSLNSGSLTMTGCTLCEASPHGGESLTLSGVSPAIIENTLIAFDASGPAVVCEGTVPVLSCCDLYGNAGGDWTDPIANQLGIRGNICEDPVFCSDAPHEDRDWTIRADSPCAPAQSECGLIGAWGVGCEVTPVRPITWGRIKADFGG
jgi:predicted outer membrane repeat protein